MNDKRKKQNDSSDRSPRSEGGVKIVNEADASTSQEDDLNVQKGVTNRSSMEGGKMIMMGRT